MTTLRRRREEGAAAVELALLMLVFVPVIMYSMILHDMLRYRLDVQEVVTTAAWDFTSLNYNGLKAGPLQNTSNTLKALWCDHSGVVDGDDPNGECASGNGDDKFHLGQAVASHQCWKASDAREVSCTIDNNFRRNALNQTGVDLLLNQFAYGSTLGEPVQTGGKVTCTATVAVYNNLLPRTFMQQLSETEMTNIDRQDDGAQMKMGAGLHGKANDPHWKYSYTFALETDTWSVHAGNSHDGHKFYGTGGTSSHSGRSGGNVVNSGEKDQTQFKRSRKLHDITVIPAAAAAVVFFAQGTSNRIFMGAPFIGSVPGNFEMDARRQPTGFSRPDSSGNYYSTPYRYIDSNRDDYKRVHDDRKVSSGRGYYMGCRQAKFQGCK